MCYQRMFKLSPVSRQKGQRIKTGKNNSWFSKLFEGDSQGKFNIKYHGWLINFMVESLWKNYFQLFFDMLYGVNNLELGINDILQLIELTLGEGEL